MPGTTVAPVDLQLEPRAGSLADLKAGVQPLATTPSKPSSLAAEMISPGGASIASERRMRVSTPNPSSALKQVERYTSGVVVVDYLAVKQSVGLQALTTVGDLRELRSEEIAPTRREHYSGFVSPS